MMYAWSRIIRTLKFNFLVIIEVLWCSCYDVCLFCSCLRDCESERICGLEGHNSSRHDVWKGRWRWRVHSISSWLEVCIFKPIYWEVGAAFQVKILKASRTGSQDLTMIQRVSLFLVAFHPGWCRPLRMLILHPCQICLVMKTRNNLYEQWTLAICCYNSYFSHYSILFVRSLWYFSNYCWCIRITLNKGVLHCMLYAGLKQWNSAGIDIPICLL